MPVYLDVSMMPQLAEAVGKKRIELDFEGGSLSDLFDHLMVRFGRKARSALLDSTGQIDPIIKVVLDGNRFIVRESFPTTMVSSGDRIKIMAFLAGG